MKSIAVTVPDDVSKKLIVKITGNWRARDIQVAEMAIRKEFIRHKGEMIRSKIKENEDE